VRSGTTMLRDLLRLHPRLACPEETHFYRWADPYGSPRYDKNYITMKLFENHRSLDGISDARFHESRHLAQTRRDISQAYGSLYLESVGKRDGRWFDKTPQNVYGIFLLSRQFPDSKLVHIHRHPLNVVASLVEGRVMAKHSVKGAINYWMESMTLINEYKKLYPERLYELHYERVCNHPEKELRELCDFLQEDFDLLDRSKINLHREENKYLKVLSAEEVSRVVDACEEFMDFYGYSRELKYEAASNG